MGIEGDNPCILGPRGVWRGYGVRDDKKKMGGHKYVLWQVHFMSRVGAGEWKTVAAAVVASMMKMDELSSSPKLS